jgi:hypothetical protein
MENAPSLFDSFPMLTPLPLFLQLLHGKPPLEAYSTR